MASVYNSNKVTIFGAEMNISSALEAGTMIIGGASGFVAAGAASKTVQAILVGASAAGKVPRGFGSGDTAVPIVMGNVIVQADTDVLDAAVATFTAGETVAPAASGQLTVVANNAASGNVIGVVISNDGDFAYILIKTGKQNAINYS